jgi:hypothetical protein
MKTQGKLSVSMLGFDEEWTAMEKFDWTTESDLIIID